MSILVLITLLAILQVCIPQNMRLLELRLLVDAAAALVLPLPRAGALGRSGVIPAAAGKGLGAAAVEGGGTAVLLLEALLDLVVVFALSFRLRERRSGA